MNDEYDDDDMANDDMAFMYAMYLNPDLHPAGCTCGCGEDVDDEFKRCWACGEYMEPWDDAEFDEGGVFVGWVTRWYCANPDCERNE